MPKVQLGFTVTTHIQARWVDFGAPQRHRCPPQLRLVADIAR